MPRNSSGTYSRVSPPGSGGYTAGTTIDPAIVNGEVNDLSTELTNSIDKGGRTTPTANLPMGGFKHTSVGDGAARNDYAAVGQIQDGGLVKAAATGTANTYAVSISPAIPAYVHGAEFVVAFPVANTGVSTLNVNGLGAKAIKKYHQGAYYDLSANDITATWQRVRYYTGIDLFELVNPGSNFGPAPICWGSVSTSGTLLRGFNCTSTKTGLGVYEITITNYALAGASNWCIVGSCEEGDDVFGSSQVAIAAGKFRVRIARSGVYADGAFRFVVY